MGFFTADIISCVEFNSDGDLLATGDKGGRVVIFQRDKAVSYCHRASVFCMQLYNLVRNQSCLGDLI